MNRCTTRAALAGLILALGTTAHAGTIVWEGVTWDDNFGPSTLALSGPDLTVTPPDATSYGAAHYNTPVPFRNAPSQFVEASFRDSGGGERHQIWIEDEQTAGPDRGFWIQFGTWYGFSTNIQIFYNDYDADFADNGAVDFSTGAFFDTGIAASAGDHSVGVGMRADGTIEFLYDGVLVHSRTDLTPRYFGDVYLGARLGTGTFTAYETSTDFTGAAAPAPATGLLLAAAVLPLLCRRRRG